MENVRLVLAQARCSGNTRHCPVLLGKRQCPPSLPNGEGVPQGVPLWWAAPLLPSSPSSGSGSHWWDCKGGPALAAGGWAWLSVKGERPGFKEREAEGAGQEATLRVCNYWKY